MSEATERFIDELVAQHPVLRPLFEEHLSDNFGEALPHVFFADLVALVVRSVLSDKVASAGYRPLARLEVKGLLDHLEAGFQFGTDEVKELIAVSFLEGLPARNEPGSELCSWLGPTLSDELGRIQG